MTIFHASNLLSKNASKLLLSIKNVSLTHHLPIRTNLKCFHRHTISTPKCNKLNNVTQSVQWLLAGGVVVSAKICFDSKIAKCEARIEPLPILEKIQDTKESIKEVKDVNTLPWDQLLQYILPHILSLAVAVAAALTVAIVNTKIGIAIGSLVNVVSSNISQNDEALTGASTYMQQIKGPAMNLIKLYLLHCTCTFSYIYSLAIVGERMAAELRKDLFAKMMVQDMAFFDTHKTQDIISRLTLDVQEFKSSFKQVVSQGLRSLTQTVGSAVALYQLSPNLSGIMLVVVPSVILIGTGIGSFLRVLSKKAQAQAANSQAVGDEAISNVRLVRSFAMEDFEMDRYSTEVGKAQKLNEYLGMGIGLFQSGTVLFLNGIVLSTLYYGGYLLSVQELTPGDLMAFLVSTQNIQRSLGQMSLLFGQYVRGSAAGARVFEYMNLEPTIPIQGGLQITNNNLRGQISLNNVTFTYPSRPEQSVLEDFNLEIPGGKICALVGASGGGKSTVASLLERFYDCDNGSLTIDGIDIKTLDLRWLRRNCIGYINQEPTLFATSIWENIRYGRPDATDIEVMEAARSANAHEFIANFPNGYDTVVGERGVTVSGGQKQRIAIARALLKNPSILILDEATSALDAESERLVQESLDSLCKGRTVLVIAHRLSTIQNAHVIAVIHNGKVKELGTHQELKILGGIYSNLIKQQEQMT